MDQLNHAAKVQLVVDQLENHLNQSDHAVKAQLEEDL